MLFTERDFLLASGNRVRQLWAEHYLEFSLSSEESWRLASYAFLRGRFEERLSDDRHNTLDLRPGRDEDPQSPSTKRDCSRRWLKMARPLLERLWNTRVFFSGFRRFPATVLI